ncbi:MAG: hypothetical protein QM533_05395 [Cytophagales bacterium]|nr:hypothetical protein [Cytophagales bacterium]
MKYRYTALAAMLAVTHTVYAQTQPVQSGDIMGRVIASTPVVQQFAVPSQVCTTQQVAVQQPKSGAGSLMGAIAGGAIGNSVGGGFGRAAATMIGVVGGAVVGDSIEGQPAPQMQNVQTCGMQTNYENRTVGYNVVYEYGGKQYSVQMPQAPGEFIPLQVTPIGSAPVATVQQPIMQAPQVATPQPIVYSPAPVVVAAPYPYPYAHPYWYPNVSIGFGFGFGFGHGRRWR